MHNARIVFNSGVDSAKSLSGLYQFLSKSVAAPFSYDDILRFQVVFSVSAFDKLLHDLVRIGIIQIYTGSRAATPKYSSETISIAMHSDLVAAVMPPKEHVFEQEIVRKLRVLSYQDPAKISEGLSFIWNEKHKWQKISDAMGKSKEDVEIRLKLIAARRNAIVHEADIDPITHQKNSIEDTEAISISEFLQSCGNAICDLVL